MSKSNYEMVREFHEKFNSHIGVPFDKETIFLRLKLIEEEYKEIRDEVVDDIVNTETHPDGSESGHTAVIHKEVIDKANLTKEISDLLYVAYGMAITYDLPIQEVFAETHRSNMSKLGDDGKPVYREDGKILKGPNFSPANVAQFF